MTNSLSIAVSQVNFCVGDLQGNSDKILSSYKKAVEQGADILVFSELSLIGYPPEDLILRKDFIDKSLEKLEYIASKTSSSKTNNKTAILLGSVYRDKGGEIFNSAFLLFDGKIQSVTSKHELPDYGVFDESRVFCKGELPKPILFKGVKLGVLICEDIWFEKSSRHLSENGADIFISLNASPFEIAKQEVRENILKTRSLESNLPSIYVNQVGGQDELVFAGLSCFTSSKGDILYRMACFEEDFFITKFDCIKSEFSQLKASQSAATQNNKYQQIYDALTLGLRDYVLKSGFNSVLIGMSGGIDSALVAAIACNAIGAENVNLVMMPSKYTSKDSLKDADDCAKMLEAKIQTIAIEPIIDSFNKRLDPIFKGLEADLTEENIQSRIRGNLLMALSNKFGSIVITTGNKSEMAVGYATIYGDMCGAFNPLKDLYKTEVFALAKYINTIKLAIPENIISKPPSAELRENQKDEDSLPPYEILDEILRNLIENRKSVDDISDMGFEKGLVSKIAKLLKNSEYKRKQSPIGTKITSLSFGKERRYPITSKFVY